VCVCIHYIQIGEARDTDGGVHGGRLQVSGSVDGRARRGT
jgi:hypothetical protein